MESVNPPNVHATMPVKAIKVLRDLASLKRLVEIIKIKLTSNPNGK